MTPMLLGLVSASVSVSLLLAALLALKKPLLARYRANTLWMVGLLLVALLLCPWRPSLLPKGALPDTVITPIRVGATVDRQEQVAKGAAQDVSAAAPTDSEASAPPVEPIAPRISARWDAMLFGLWLAGALAALGLKALRHARFSRLTRRWRQPLSGPDRAVLATECAALNMRMPPAWRAPLITSPMVVGLLRPALLMPDAEIPKDQLTLMLRHELLHIRRGDLLGVALIELALCAHWFNPLLIWARRELSALCELACDEAVLRDCTASDRSLYLRAMLAALPCERRLPISTRFDGGVKNMKYRMSRLFEIKPRKMGAVVIICVLLLALLTGNVLAVPEAVEARRSDLLFDPPEARMTDEEYEYVMGLRLPDYEQLTLKVWRDYLSPHAERLVELFNQRAAENEFMDMLQWDLDDMTRTNSMRSIVDVVMVPYRQVDGPGLYRSLVYLIYTKIPDQERITVGRRNEVIRQIQGEMRKAYTPRALRGLTEPDLREGMRQVMDDLQSELSGDGIDVLLVISDLEDEAGEVYGDMPQAELDELLAMVPAGYLGMSVREFDALVKENLPRIQEVFKEHYTSHWTVGSIRNSMTGLMGEPYDCGVNWTDGVDFRYTFSWSVSEPDWITVSERDSRINAASERVWAELVGNIDETWMSDERTEYMVKACERICAELSDVGMTVSVSDVRFEPTTQLVWHF